MRSTKGDALMGKKIVDYDVAIKMLEGGTSRNEIANHFNVHVSSINEGFRKRGIPDTSHKGYITTWNGYIKIRRPGHGRADSKGYVAEHTLVIEEYLGRLLEENEVVHHIDGNRNNNLISNLEVMDREVHRSMHSKRKRKI